jgi:hypothetical protein
MGNTVPEVRGAVLGVSSQFHGQRRTGGACGGLEEGCMVDRKGKWKAGNVLVGHKWAGKHRNGMWEAGAQLECEICKRGLSVCTVESPLTAGLHHIHDGHGLGITYRFLSYPCQLLPCRTIPMPS